ncbi:hypothetical protein B0H14DRAFT_3503579 [Mycena olivaceomarginata]|nr:hypothetical protein B0H14DRAFT_3503579 [Mycena olivaceomarginata]
MPPKFTCTVDLQKGEHYVDNSHLYLCHHHLQYTHQFDHQYNSELAERFWPKYQTPAEGSEMQESEGADDAQAEPKKQEQEEMARKGEWGDGAEMEGGTRKYTGLTCLGTGVLQNLVAKIQYLEMSTVVGGALPPGLEYGFTIPR